jgi:hypothetical protein
MHIVFALTGYTIVDIESAVGFAMNSSFAQLEAYVACMPACIACRIRMS